MAYDIPSNMEGRTPNPYRTPFSWRRALSDVLYNMGSSAALGPLAPAGRLADRMTGYRVRGNTTDRLFGAQDDRLLQDYNNYMRGMMRQDDPSSLRSRITSWFSGRNRGNQQGGNPYEPPPYEAETFGIPGFNDGLQGGGGPYRQIRVDPSNPYLAQDAYSRQALRQFGQRNRSTGGPQQRDSAGYMGDIAYEWTRPLTADDIRFGPRQIER